MSAEAWSYHVERVFNFDRKRFDGRLTELGEAGWELVTSVSTNKVIAAIGNELVFVFKKPGVGHVAPSGDGETDVPY